MNKVFLSLFVTGISTSAVLLLMANEPGVSGAMKPLQADQGPKGTPPSPNARTASFSSPPDSAIPSGALGDTIRFGAAIFRDPSRYAGPYVGNTLKCSNCHLDGGRQADAGPMGPAYVEYPAYRAKNGHVNTFEERLQGCFRFSMNGKAPPLGDKVLVALETYAYFLAKGAPTGEDLPGRGFRKLPKPALGMNFARGAAVFSAKCAGCHGTDGLGQKANGQTVFPALWGTDSFNWGAGMASIDDAAGFIKVNMPLGQGNTLTDQQAWDVAMFVESHERPQDPRFLGSVEATRAKFHDSDMSMYGKTVNGVLLGQNAPPSGPQK